MEHNGFKIVGDNTYGNKVIKTIGSGKLPKALRGSYTQEKFAARAIDQYVKSTEEEVSTRPVLKRKPVKGEENAKAKDTAGG